MTNGPVCQTAEDAPRAVVRLRPKTDARRLRFGFPWVYDNELVTDRRTRSIAPGQLAVLEDANRAPLGLVAMNPGSRIIARVLDRRPDARIDVDWFEERLARALDLRTRLFSDPFYRLVHAEADDLPGVVIDRFGDVLAIQPNVAWAEAHLDPLVAAAQRVTGARTVVKNAGGRARSMEGLDDRTLVLAGSVAGPVDVPMNGAIYKADLLGGQKTGLFFDQRPNHAFAAGLAKDARVLDVFSHVGGFGLAALVRGAASARAIDGSAAALGLAVAGARASGFADRFSATRGDAFAVMSQIARDGETFDLVVCDPPAFAPARAALEAGLRAYEKVARSAAALVAPGGFLGLCSCSHAADLARFRAASLRGIGKAGRRAQLLHTGFAGPDHPQHPALDESGYLKALFLRLD